MNLQYPEHEKCALNVFPQKFLHYLKREEEKSQFIALKNLRIPSGTQIIKVILIDFQVFFFLLRPGVPDFFFSPFPLQAMSLTQLSKTEKQKCPSSFELDTYGGVTRLNKWGGFYFLKCYAQLKYICVCVCHLHLFLSLMYFQAACTPAYVSSLVPAEDFKGDESSILFLPRIADRGRRWLLERSALARSLCFSLSG